MILILGTGRSGTTFLGKLFDSHPQVLYRHEPDAIHVDRTLPFLPSAGSIERHRQRAAQYLEELKGVRAPRVAAKLPLFAKSYRSYPAQLMHSGSVMLSKAAGCLPFRLPAGGLQVSDLISRGEAEKVSVVIKSVNSLCRARLFSEARPETRIVHIVRHPCGVIASNMRGVEKGLMPREVYLDSLFAMDEIAQYGVDIETVKQWPYPQQLAFQWMVQNDKVIVEMSARPRYALLRYEDLCATPMGTLGGLFQQCGLDMNGQTRRFVDELNSTEQGKSSYFSVMRDPGARHAAWHHELSAETIALILDTVRHSKSGQLYLDAARP